MPLVVLVLVLFPLLLLINSRLAMAGLPCRPRSPLPADPQTNPSGDRSQRRAASADSATFPIRTDYGKICALQWAKGRAHDGAETVQMSPNRRGFLVARSTAPAVAACMVEGRARG